MVIWNRSVIGMEMDSKEIRAVELKGSQKKHSVSAWGSIKLPEGVVRDGRIINSELCSDYIRRLLKENGFKSKDVVLGVNNQDVIVRFASFPKVPDDKIRNMIYFQAQDHIPVPMEEIELDYVVLGNKTIEDREFIEVILVGARKNMLNVFIEAFNRAELILMDIDSTLLSLGRAALVDSHIGTFSLVGFNNDIGNILIFRNGLLGVARSITLNQLPEWTTKENSQAVDNENRMADVLFGELKSSLGYYKIQNQEDINKIYVLGTDSQQNDVVSRLRETTGLDVSVPKPYTQLEAHTRKKIAEVFEATNYVACITLAMRGLEE